jgi:hypothetical protein
LTFATFIRRRFFLLEAVIKFANCAISIPKAPATSAGLKNFDMRPIHFITVRNDGIRFNPRCCAIWNRICGIPSA